MLKLHCSTLSRSWSCVSVWCWCRADHAGTKPGSAQHGHTATSSRPVASVAGSVHLSLSWPPNICSACETWLESEILLIDSLQFWLCKPSYPLNSDPLQLASSVQSVVLREPLLLVIRLKSVAKNSDIWQKQRHFPLT